MICYTLTYVMRKRIKINIVNQSFQAIQESLKKLYISISPFLIDF